MVVNLGEKKGGIRKLDKGSESFQNTIDSLNWIEILTKNGIFTWNNRRGGDRKETSRLVCFLISEEIYLTS